MQAPPERAGFFRLVKCLFGPVEIFWVKKVEEGGDGGNHDDLLDALAKRSGIRHCRL